MKQEKKHIMEITTWFFQNNHIAYKLPVRLKKKIKEKEQII